MAMQEYEITNEGLVQPPSGIYNPNEGQLVLSGAGASATTANYIVLSQGFNFQFWRQNIIIPDGTFTDPRVTFAIGGDDFAVNSSFMTSATHNRILVQGTATFSKQLLTTTIFTVNAARIPQTFQAMFAASGLSGNGLYTSGYGNVPTVQQGYVRNLATDAEVSKFVPITRNINFIFAINLKVGPYLHGKTYDPVNGIIRQVAEQIKLRYIPEYRTDLLLV